MVQNTTREPAQEKSVSQTNHDVPDGIVAHRKTVRALGGFVALGGAMSVLIAGLGLLVLPGAITGVLGFVLIVIALPTLPLFGIPAAGGFINYVGGFITSAVVWWISTSSVHTTDHPPSAFTPRISARAEGWRWPMPLQWGTW